MRGQIVKKSNKLMVAAMALAIATAGRADFLPVRLTSDSYTHDIVVEKTASPPLVPVTTASMEGGLANDNFTWYERGYMPDWPTTGLPKAGTRCESEIASDHQYQFAASYKQNNAVLLDALVTNATFNVVNPTTCVSLSFLVSGGNGGGKIAYTIHHENGAAQKGSFACTDWFNGPMAAYTAAGRINVSTFAFDMNPGNPRLYAWDVALTNTSSPVTSIDFVHVSGLGHAAIFGVSGSPRAGELFLPFLVNGYNQDIVVEAECTRPGFLAGFTTASVDDGSANSGNTLYEQGYYPPAPLTGLPSAGTTITAANARDHRYALAPNYTGNNVALVDAVHPSANLTPASPARYARLSFLTSAGHGPVTNRCVVQHLDGRSQTNQFVSPDWFDSAPAALSVNGRIKLSQKLVSSLDANGPSLFAADLSLANTSSPVTNLVISYAGGGLNSHAVIFAVGGSDIPAPPVVAARLLISGSPDSGWLIHATAPGRLQSTTAFEGNRTLWKDEGPISTAVRINPAQSEPTRFYRVVSP
jgi:hypothetical protein